MLMSNNFQKGKEWKNNILKVLIIKKFLICFLNQKRRNIKMV